MNSRRQFLKIGSDAAITEAFDEPLTMAEVNTIASVFINS